jgi:hypothetical protein
MKLVVVRSGLLTNERLMSIGEKLPLQHGDGNVRGVLTKLLLPTEHLQTSDWDRSDTVHFADFLQNKKSPFYSMRHCYFSEI